MWQRLNGGLGQAPGAGLQQPNGVWAGAGGNRPNIGGAYGGGGYGMGRRGGTLSSGYQYTPLPRNRSNQYPLPPIVRRPY